MTWSTKLFVASRNWWIGVPQTTQNGCSCNFSFHPNLIRNDSLLMTENFWLAIFISLWNSIKTLLDEMCWRVPFRNFSRQSNTPASDHPLYFLHQCLHPHCHLWAFLKTYVYVSLLLQVLAIVAQQTNRFLRPLSKSKTTLTVDTKFLSLFFSFDPQSHFPSEALDCFFPSKQQSASIYLYFCQYFNPLIAFLLGRLRRLKVEPSYDYYRLFYSIFTKSSVWILSMVVRMNKILFAKRLFYRSCCVLFSPVVLYSFVLRSIKHQRSNCQWFFL